MVTMTQTLDFDTFAIIAPEIDVQIRRAEETGSAEALKERNLEELLADEKENLVSRPPVIVVMGHVDHGKTKSSIPFVKTKVAEGEAEELRNILERIKLKKGSILYVSDTWS